MEFDLITMRLEIAMEQPGCPICRRRSDTELSYIRDLLWEHINDGETRGRIMASLGFCQDHVWRINAIEKEAFGSVLETLRLYQQLAGILQTRLTKYTNYALKPCIPRWQLWLRQTFLPRISLPKAKELIPHRLCRVCQVGNEAVDTGLEWLLKGLSEPKSQFRELYTNSDGLCLMHFQQVLISANQATKSGAAFLVDETIQRLSILQGDLDVFAEQEISKYRGETYSQDRTDSWRQVLNFFGGNPDTKTKSHEELPE